MQQSTGSEVARSSGRVLPVAPVLALLGVVVSVVLVVVGGRLDVVLGLSVFTLAVVAALSTLEWRRHARGHQTTQAAMRQMVEVQGEALDRMAETERLKDNLLAVVSHEFRTPLTAIIGFAQTLRRFAEPGEALPATTVEMSAERIERNGLRLSRLIGNMLAATMDVRPETGRFYPVRDTIDVVASELGAAQGGGVPVEVEVPAEITARMSREHLRLLLSNLIDNGMKFAEEGSALNIKGRMAGKEVALTFTNRGPEIPEEMREQIFAPFVQVDLSDTRPYDGVGLGLHVVRKLCDAHGGGLAVRCQDGLVVLGVTMPAGPSGPIGLAGQADGAGSGSP